MPDVFFAFDLDGTVTTEEILPRLAECLGLREEMERLTRRAVRGDDAFAVSFRARVDMLGALPLAEARRVTAETPLDPAIVAFIRKRRDCCALVTGNLDYWVKPLVESLGCRAFTSAGEFKNNRLTVKTILDKAEAVRELARNGAKVVAVGESAGDIPLFETADVGIAYAGVHEPAPTLLPLARHVARSGEDLCALLRMLEEELRG
jgi:phosphoserine phosphatase